MSINSSYSLGHSRLQLLLKRRAYQIKIAGDIYARVHRQKKIQQEFEAKMKYECRGLVILVIFVGMTIILQNRC